MSFKILIVAVALFATCNAGTFSYDDNAPDGPSKWGGICESGKRQTPVILTQSVKEVFRNKKSIFISGANARPESITYKNNGHGMTISFNFKSDHKIILSGEVYGSDRYVFHSAHGHWPCEHPLGYMRCDMEMHYVHFNEKYGNISNAIDKSDGLAVLGVRYVVDKNAKRLNFLQFADDVSVYNSSVTDRANTYTVASMLPTEWRRYYNYQGSLTTPGCFESVTWVVLETPVFLNDRDLKVLKDLKDTKGNPLIRSNRPTQPLNGRVVNYYRPVKKGRCRDV